MLVVCVSIDQHLAYTHSVHRHPETPFVHLLALARTQNVLGEAEAEAGDTHFLTGVQFVDVPVLFQFEETDTSGVEVFGDGVIEDFLIAELVLFAVANLELAPLQVGHGFAPLLWHKHVVVFVHIELAVGSGTHNQIDEIDSALLVLPLFDGIVEELVETLVEVDMAPHDHFPYHVVATEAGVGDSTFATGWGFHIEIVRIATVFGIDDALGIDAENDRCQNDDA